MKRVVLDAGHGGSDPGAIGNGLREKDFTLPLTLETERELLAGWQVEVILTRRTDVFVSIANRASFGRGADLFVSQHLDFNASAEPRGFWTWRNTYVRPETPVYQKAIHDEVYKAIRPMGAPDRGLRVANHDITRLPPYPTVLIEYLFISNPADAAILRNSQNITAMAKATAKGIAEALSLPPKTVEPNWPVYPIPTIVKNIGVELDGVRTDELGFLAYDPVTGLLQTYLRVGFMAPLPESLVTPHGDFIRIRRK
jgi:N-acetylmuramoyl-L-alanine amidase